MEQLVDNILLDFKIDRSHWKLTKFGEVAMQQKQSVDREQTELTKYVKGEHMGSQDLHLREWGELTDEYLGPAFIRRFDGGDILYGSRRTYLRKVVLAPFSGITSNTTFVIKANNKRIDSRLLPFILMSEGFTEHSVKNSKGSVNPYINWKDIADYQFLLPPKEEQAQLAELLWAIDEVIEKELGLKVKTESLRDINREKLFTYGIQALHHEGSVRTKIGKSGLLKKEWREDTFFNLIDIVSGQVDPTLAEYSGLIQIGSERIEPNTGRITEFTSAAELNISSGNYLFTADHVIYSKIRPYFKKVALPGMVGLCSADIYPLMPKTDAVNNRFLFHFMLTEKFTRKLLRFQNRTGMPKVNREELNSMFIPLPTLEEQILIVKVLDQVQENIDVVGRKIEKSKVLQKSLINQIF